MRDIESRADIILLVDTFYGKVKQNEVIGHIFSEVANVNWQNHLPMMYSFWSSILLREHSYTGNPMFKHVDLSHRYALTENDFQEWIKLFHKTVDELFEGDKAHEAKSRASTIAQLILQRIQLPKIADRRGFVTSSV